MLYMYKYDASYNCGIKRNTWLILNESSDWDRIKIKFEYSINLNPQTNIFLKHKCKKLLNTIGLETTNLKKNTIFEHKKYRNNFWTQARNKST